MVQFTFKQKRKEKKSMLEYLKTFSIFERVIAVLAILILIGNGIESFNNYQKSQIYQLAREGEYIRQLKIPLEDLEQMDNKQQLNIYLYGKEKGE